MENNLRWIPRYPDVEPSDVALRNGLSQSEWSAVQAVEDDLDSSVRMFQRLDLQPLRVLCSEIVIALVASPTGMAVLKPEFDRPSICCGHRFGSFAWDCETTLLNARSFRGYLCLTAIIAPAIGDLSTVEIQRMSTRLVVSASSRGRSGQLLGVDWQDQAAVGSSVQGGFDK
jgi:hypothetical protein